MGHASVPPGEDPRNPAGRIGGVESLRALAAISVLGFHAVFASGLAQSSSWLKPYASRLDVGVSVFFVISGFLLYRSWARSHLEQRPSPRLSRYTASRLLRIIPAYWVALLVISVWIGLNSVLDFPGFAVYFGFLQNYDPDTLGGGILQAWSLGVEVTYYAFLPLFALAVMRLPARDEASRRRNQWVGVGTLFAVGVAWNAGVTAGFDAGDDMLGPLLSWLPAYLDQFALGMGLALLTVSGAGPVKRLSEGSLGRRGAIICLAIAALAFVIAARAIGFQGGYAPEAGIHLFAKHMLFSVVAMSLLVIAALTRPQDGLVGRFFGSVTVRWLGLVSYGIFLWHLAVLTQMQEWSLLPESGSAAGWLAWTAVALVPTLIVAALSWYAIERPALERRDSVAAALRSLRRRRTEAAA